VEIPAEYAERGRAVALAWLVMWKGTDTPPSLEVFAYGLARVRERRPTLTPLDYAHGLLRGDYR
jgi:hypothetical protein